MAFLKKRLDQYLFDNQHAESRSKARALIMGRNVKVNGEYITKPGHIIRDIDHIELIDLQKYVSRGGEKLESLFVHKPELFDLIRGKKIIDLGASTGGFSDFFLQNGASRILAVDVGYGQLHPTLQNDSRVEILDRINARYLQAEQLRGGWQLFSTDLSFISVCPILEKIKEILGNLPGIILVKPQFELSREKNSKGVVKEWSFRREAIIKVAHCAFSLQWGIYACYPSAVKGPKGNQEYFLVLGGDDIVNDIKSKRNRENNSEATSSKRYLPDLKWDMRSFEKFLETVPEIELERDGKR